MPFSAFMSVSELVMAVTGTFDGRCAAICSTVVESSKKMACPGSTNCIAASAISFFSADWRFER
ncbi:hypothetical protein AJ87_39845 [Rhizobium yanglingense]|nr:hypothetical protein AJ87_39845 [Rhizobium yanglingense]